MQGVHDGAGLVLASGDKIIGGPQAGIVVGKKACVQRLSRHVLARTCRPGKLTLSALEATPGRVFGRTRLGRNADIANA